MVSGAGQTNNRQNPSSVPRLTCKRPYRRPPACVPPWLLNAPRPLQRSPVSNWGRSDVIWLTFHDLFLLPAPECPEQVLEELGKVWQRYTCLGAMSQSGHCRVAAGLGATLCRSSMKLCVAVERSYSHRPSTVQEKLSDVASDPQLAAPCLLTFEVFQGL